MALFLLILNEIFYLIKLSIFIVFKKLYTYKSNLSGIVIFFFAKKKLWWSNKYSMIFILNISVRKALAIRLYLKVFTLKRKMILLKP